MEQRDIVREVPDPIDDLSYDECEMWMRELGLVAGKRLDWKRLLRDADVGTDQYNLKARWNRGEAPEDRAKVRAKLLEMETKRKERTPTGARVIGLREWMRIGEALVLEPDIFDAEVSRLEKLVGPIRKKHEAQLAVNAAAREIEDATAALRSISPEPRSSRK